MRVYIKITFYKDYKQYEENILDALEFKLLRRRYYVKKLRLFEAKRVSKL